jgi:2-(1,2-epoxy-1,2-dihydrophenyl)acetyl-CoA isomerase
MVNEVVPDETLVERGRALAARLASMPTVAIASMKEVLNAALGIDLEPLLAHEARIQQRHGATADYAEGVAAFKAKRRPRFTGR